MAKANNKNLSSAKREKNDEFYTPIAYIEKELKHYREFLRGKVVFCNCDDPESSNFWSYFASNFEFLGLKKLTSTHYETDKPSYKQELCSAIDCNGKVDTQGTIKTPLSQNGDFRSPECVELLKECDVVITNPPFSLFREYLTQLVEYEKLFLIIGSLNAITYREVIPLLMSNDMWLGVNSGNCDFVVPNCSETHVVRVCWFTNIPVENPPEPLKLYKKYTPGEYPTYDNFDAINVDKVCDIPCDYFGIIGVPITYALKHDPKQFEIIGSYNNGEHGEAVGAFKVSIVTNGTIMNWNGPVINGKPLYKRLLIKRRTT